MADASVLKDFLVSVHWDISEAEFKKAIATVGTFTQQLKQLDKGHDDLSKKAKSTWTEFAKQVTEFGEKAIVAGVAIEEMVKRQAEIFENLFFLSQRTGASVQNLIAFSTAASAIGTSADSAKAAIVSMTQAIKLDPSAAAAWRALGINPNEDPTKLLPDLARRLRGMNPRLQRMYAQRTGTPWEPLESAIAPGGAERIEHQQARITGVDRSMNLTEERLQKLAKDSVEFMEELAVLTHAFKDIATVSLIALLPIFDALVKAITPVVVGFGKWNSAMGGVPGAIIELIATIKATQLAFRLARGALGLLGLGGAGATAAGVGAGAGGVPLAAGVTAGAAIGGLGAAGEKARQQNPITKNIPWWLHAMSLGGIFSGFTVPGAWLYRQFQEGGQFYEGEGAHATTPDEHATTPDRHRVPAPAVPGYPHGHTRNMAEGGVVPINAHAGEIVLPAGLSRGLLGMVNALKNSDTNETFTSAKRSAESLIAWIGGMIAPHVTIANFQDLIDKQLLLGDKAPTSTTPGDGDGAGRPGGAGKGNIPGTGKGGDETPSTPSGPAGTVSDQKNYSAIAVNEMKKAGWSEAAIKATLGTVLGEGGWKEAWKQSSAHDPKTGRREESYGPYQLFKGGELPGYLKWAKANNIENPQQDVAAQTRYFIKRADELTHGRFGHSTNVDAARKSISGTWHGAMSATHGQIAQQYGIATSGITPSEGGVAPSAPAGTDQPSGGDPRAQINVPAGFTGGRFTAQKNAGMMNKALVETLVAASKLLPPGWSAYSTAGHEGGHASDSRHLYGTAMDLHLVAPGGKVLPNRGDAGPNDPYTKFAQLWHSQVQRMYPNLEKFARWGGEFKDKMHFDFDFSGRPIPRKRHDWTGGQVDASNTSHNYYIASTNPREAADEVNRHQQRQKKPSQIHTRNMRTHVA